MNVHHIDRFPRHCRAYEPRRGRLSAVAVYPKVFARKISNYIFCAVPRESAPPPFLRFQSRGAQMHSTLARMISPHRFSSLRSLRACLLRFCSSRPLRFEQIQRPDRPPICASNQTPQHHPNSLHR